MSYLGAAPTGVASEAEYLEIGLAVAVDLDALRQALDAALPDGLDILAAVDVAATGPGSLAERIEASHWRLELFGVDPATAEAAVVALLAETEVAVQRLTKDGRKSVDVRGPIVSAAVSAVVSPPRDSTSGQPRAILDLVVRQAIPAVRPDDVLSALRAVAGLALDAPPRVVRLAQGPLDEAGRVGDPLIVGGTQAETAS